MWYLAWGRSVPLMAICSITVMWEKSISWFDQCWDLIIRMTCQRWKVTQDLSSWNPLRFCCQMVGYFLLWTQWLTEPKVAPLQQNSRFVVFSKFSAEWQMVEKRKLRNWNQLTWFSPGKPVLWRLWKKRKARTYCGCFEWSRWCFEWRRSFQTSFDAWFRNPELCTTTRNKSPFFNIYWHLARS